MSDELYGKLNSKKKTCNNFETEMLSLALKPVTVLNELPPSSFKLDLHSTGKNSALCELFSIKQKCLAFICDTFSLNLKRK